MLNQRVRQLIVENFQDSLRLVRHLMEFKVEEFAEAIGETSQTVTDLEAKKIEMSPTQYIAIAALIDNYLVNHESVLYKLKEIIDSDGKSYDEEYETSFRNNSLLKYWFEDFVSHENLYKDEAPFPNTEELLRLAKCYKIFLDMKILLTDDAKDFFKNLIIELENAPEETITSLRSSIIVPMRSIEELKAEITPDEFAEDIFFINKMRDIGVIGIFGDATDPDFYLTVYAVFTRIREKHKLCLITSDEYLAYRILPLERNNANELEFVIAPAFFENGSIKFYDVETLEEKFEAPGKRNHIILDPEYICSEFDFDTEDDTEVEVKGIPEDEHAPADNKFKDWGEL